MLVVHPEVVDAVAALRDPGDLVLGVEDRQDAFPERKSSGRSTPTGRSGQNEPDRQTSEGHFINCTTSGASPSARDYLSQLLVVRNLQMGN